MKTNKFNTTTGIGALLGLLLLGGAAGVFGQDIIDFETVPGMGTPTDGMVIHNQYAADYGVIFELRELNGDPVDPMVGPTIAQVGSPKTAFVGFPSQDTPCDGNPGATTDDVTLLPGHTGCFLLTDDDTHPGPRPFSLRIIYTTPVLQAGAELVDVDGGPEAWRIEALDENEVLIPHAGNPIDVVYPTTPGTGDGTVYQWSFDFSDTGDEIHYIDLIYTGNDDFGRGLAFDNFSPATLPTGVDNDQLSKSLVIYPCSPNPFNAKTNISFRLTQAATVTLSVYGVDGRKVRVLLNESLGPGLWTVPWDGTDATGQFVASGIYIGVLEALNETVTARLILVK
jgi:hypothetical protein